MLSPYAKSEWMTILGIGTLLSVSAGLMQLWWLLVLLLIVTAALLAFFRDPDRQVPTQRGIMVSPADGKISSVHEVEHFEPFGEGALCIRVFLSVLDVHVNRSPAHGAVLSITHKPGDHLNVLNPVSAEVNESNLIVLGHPVRRTPIAAVRQVAGLLARTIVCGVPVGMVLQRGQRIGIIKLGSTTELYIPLSMTPQALVVVGQMVQAGASVLASYIASDRVSEAAPAGAVEAAAAEQMAEPSADEPELEPDAAGGTDAEAADAGDAADPADAGDEMLELADATTPAAVEGDLFSGQPQPRDTASPPESPPDSSPDSSPDSASASLPEAAEHRTPSTQPTNPA